METKYYVYILLFVGIIFLIYHTTKVNPTAQKLIQPSKTIHMKYPENHMDLIPKNSFVKPQHKLLNLLNDISSGNKIYLKELVKRESYTNKTIPEDLNNIIIKILKKVINSINGISETNFFIKDLETTHFTMDKVGNKRFIVDTFIYDYNNHYSIRINADIVIYEGKVYINMIDIDESAINNILNNYDVKWQSNGILSKYDMRINDAESLLNESYKADNKLIDLKADTSLEFSATEKINSVFTLDQLSNYFLPSNVPTNNSPTLCKTNTDKFDSRGINFINDVSSDCIQNNNNATIKYPNTPYDAPGVVTQRVDFNAYDWMKNPIASGNILYSHGF